MLVIVIKYTAILPVVRYWECEPPVPPSVVPLAWGPKLQKVACPSPVIPLILHNLACNVIHQCLHARFDTPDYTIYASRLKSARNPAHVTGLLKFGDLARQRISLGIKRVNDFTRTEVVISRAVSMDIP